MNLETLTKKQLQQLVEQLQAQLAAVKSGTGEGEGAITDQQRQAEALTKEVAVLRAAVDEKEATIAELQVHIQALVAENASAASVQQVSSTAATATAVHNGKTYILKGRFKLKGREYSASEAAADPKTLGHLIAIGSDQVKEVNS